MTEGDRRAAPLAITLLGSLEVRLGDQTAPLPRARKALWLLALLTLHHDRELERSSLAALLWPNTFESQALFYLRRTLTELRRGLGPEAHRIHSPTARTLCLDLAGAEADVVVFDAAIARGEPASLSQAVALYRGPLLAGCQEEWVHPERVAREQAYLQALERLAAQAAERGEHAAAVDLLRRAVAADPFREKAQRALLEALATGGENAAAVRAYREFRLLLHREMNAEPDPATQAVFRQLREEAQRATRKAQSATLGAQRLISSPALRVAPCALCPSRIPRPLSSFVGREEELRELAACLPTMRLVTLTGTGGVGKTRLAIQVAEALAGEYPDGVWFVDLAPLTDPTLVPQAVSRVLGVREKPGAPLTATLQNVLGSQQLLLVLDNCEHLLEACARLAEALLGACPGMRMLATSRQALGLPGETVWRVPPLYLPPPPESGRERLTPVGEELVSILQRFGAVRLFVERAQAAAPGFTLTERNWQTTVAVCRQLEGIPLAIELAAARLKALTVEQLAARLEDRLRLLTWGSRTALPRQQTLRATLDWSYDLLAEPERALLRRLSVFAGGFSLEAAEEVCADPEGSGQPRASDEVLDLLTQLIDKSLVWAEEHGGQARYRLLETTREYERDKLAEAGEAARVRQRHRDWYLELAERAEPELQGPREELWLERLDAEYDNFRAALEWTLGREEAESAVRLAGALWRFTYMRGYMSEGRLWLERALSQTAVKSAPPQLGEARAKALHGAGVLCHEQDQFAAARCFEEESLAIRRPLGDKRAIAESLDQLGHIVNALGDSAQAITLFEESLSLRREVGDRHGAAASLNALAYMARFHGDYPRATALSCEGLSLRRELGDQWGIAYSLEVMGQLSIDQGDTRSAAAWLNECLALRQQLGDRRGIAASLVKLGRVANEEGDWSGALAHCEESLRIWRELGNTPGIAGCLRQMAATASQQGDNARANALHRESLALWQKIGQRPDIAPGLEGLAGVACSLGQAERAARLLGAAEGMREALGTPRSGKQHAAIAQAAAAARAALGQEAFAAAWAAGRAMSFDEAVTEALVGMDTDPAR